MCELTIENSRGVVGSAGGDMMCVVFIIVKQCTSRGFFCFVFLKYKKANIVDFDFDDDFLAWRFL